MARGDLAEVKRAVERERRRLLRDMEQVSREIALRMDKVQQRVLRVLLRSGKAPTRRAIQSLFERELARADRALEGVVHAGTQRAGATGARAGVRQTRAVFGAERAGVVRKALTINSSEWGERVAPRVRDLRRLLRNRSRSVAPAVTRELNAALRARESVVEAAKRIAAVDDYLPRLPQYIRDIANAAHSADAPALRAAIEEHALQMRQLGQGALKEPGAFSIRSATADFVRDVQRATPQDVERITQRWISDRKAYQARLVARTEMNDAFRRGYEESTRDHPWNYGYRWNLSGSHPELDICDVYAEQDAHGLGPGGYPSSATPPTPHPADLCFLTSIIDRDHFKRERARREGRPEPPRPWESGQTVTGEQWLQRQDTRTQNAILGRGRAAELRAGNDAVLQTRGGAVHGFRPLREVRDRE